MPLGTTNFVSANINPGVIFDITLCWINSELLDHSVSGVAMAPERVPSWLKVSSEVCGVTLGHILRAANEIEIAEFDVALH